MKNNLKENLLYKNSDISLSTTLITSGFKLITIDKSAPKRALFGFQDSNLLRKTIEDFWSDSLLVNPRIFFENLKMLKSRLYSGEMNLSTIKGGDFYD